MLLPTPISWMKKILTILKSDLSPNQISLAFALGLFAGLPPMGMHVLLPVTIALLLRCSFRTFLISMGLFKLSSLALAPGSYALGKWLLDTQRGLDAFWRWLVHLPVIAPMGYSQYILMGSVALACIMAIPSFFLIRWLVGRYRTSWSAWVSTWKISRWLKGRRGVKWGRRLLAGGEHKYALPASRKGVFRVVRREMLVGLPLLYAVAYLAAAVIVPFFAGTVATQSVSWATGTEVAVSDSSFNLLTGSLTLMDFTLQDPQVPEENLIVIPNVKVNAGMLPLLSNRIVFNSVVIAEAELHVKREADGTLNVDNPSVGWNMQGYVDWANRYANTVDWMGLLKRLFSYLREWDPLVPREDPYAAYGGSRSFPESRSPLTIQKLEIGRLLITMEDEMISDQQGPRPPLTMFEVEVSNLAFPSSLRRNPMRISLHGQWGDDAESGFSLSATFSTSQSGGVSGVDFAINRLDLPRLARFYATTLPVGIRSGLVSMTGSVQFEDGSASGSLSFLLEDLELAPSSSRSLFGLSEAMSERVVDGINGYAAEVPVVFGAMVEGASDEPSIAWEAPLLEIARQGLMMAGKRELNRTIIELGDRIDGLGGVSSVPINSRFQPLQQATESAARELIERAGGGLLQNLPVSDDATDKPANGMQTDALVDQLPRLLNDLLDSSANNGDTEGGASGSD